MPSIPPNSGNFPSSAGSTTKACIKAVKNRNMLDFANDSPRHLLFPEKIENKISNRNYYRNKTELTRSERKKVFMSHQILSRLAKESLRPKDLWIAPVRLVHVQRVDRAYCYGVFRNHIRTQLNGSQGSVGNGERSHVGNSLNLAEDSFGVG